MFEIGSLLLVIVRYDHFGDLCLQTETQLPVSNVVQSSPKLEISIVEEDSLFQLNSVYLPWPNRSPDLNHIEHIWDIIGRKVHEMTPQFKHIRK